MSFAQGGQMEEYKYKLYLPLSCMLGCLFGEGTQINF
jgi:hypothetical protein